MRKFTAAIVLIFHFCAAMLSSGLQTIAIILRHGLRPATLPPAVFVRIGFAPMNAQGASLLACMISLTPGTTVIHIDMHSREMLVHLLDQRQSAATVQTVRQQFEPPLVLWFGENA